MSTTTMTQTFRPTTDHLATIAQHERHSLVRDALFAACIMLATAVSVVTVSTASHAAHVAATTPAPIATTSPDTTSQLAHR